MQCQLSTLAHGHYRRHSKGCVWHDPVSSTLLINASHDAEQGLRTRRQLLTSYTIDMHVLHTHTPTHTHTHIYIYTHARTHARTHTRTHAHTQTHTIFFMMEGGGCLYQELSRLGAMSLLLLTGCDPPPLLPPPIFHTVDTTDMGQ